MNKITDEEVKKGLTEKDKQYDQIEEMKRKLDEKIGKLREMKDKKVGTDAKDDGIDGHGVNIDKKEETDSIEDLQISDDETNYQTVSI